MLLPCWLMTMAGVTRNSPSSNESSQRSTRQRRKSSSRAGSRAAASKLYSMAMISIYRRCFRAMHATCLNSKKASFNSATSHFSQLLHCELTRMPPCSCSPWARSATISISRHRLRQSPRYLTMSKMSNSARSVSCGHAHAMKTWLGTPVALQSETPCFSSKLQPVDTSRSRRRFADISLTARLH